MPSSTSFTVPTDWSTEQGEIDRRRAYAAALQKQAIEPTPNGQMVGDRFVPTSWTHGLAKLGQAYFGAKGQKDADERLKALGERYGAERGRVLAQALQAGQASPEVLGTSFEEPGSPAQAADPSRTYRALAASKFPDFQAAALAQALKEEKPSSIGSGGLRLRDGTIIPPQARPETPQSIGAGGLRLPNGTIVPPAVNPNARPAQPLIQERFPVGGNMVQPHISHDGGKTWAPIDGSKPQAAFAKQVGGTTIVNPPTQPLVQIMGANGQPQWVERKDAIGKTPAGAGSKAEATIAGKADVDKDVVKLKSMLDDLKAGGGITDTSEGALSNVGAYISSSPMGQAAGGAVGSKNQKARDELLMIRPSLLRSIMQSTGMSARQMDSNTELKLWLSTATDPTKSYQANIGALNSIAEKYGSGGFLENSRTSTGTITPQRRATDTTGGPNGKDRRAPKAGDVVDGYRFKGGNPSDRNSWEKQ